MLKSWINLPAKAQLEDPMLGAIRLLLRLLPLRRSPHYPLFLLSPRTSSPNSWKCSWRRPRLGTSKSYKSAHLRLGPQKSIPENLTWIAIIFFSNVWMISKPPVLQGWIVSSLPPPSSVVLLASDEPNTTIAINTPLPSCGQSLKLFIGKILEVLKSSLIVSGVSLEGTPNTSWKKPKIGHSIFNTSNLSYQSLILSRSPMN